MTAVVAEYKLGSGEIVRDRPNSHLHESVKPFLVETFARLSSGGRSFIREEVPFASDIGVCNCVKTSRGDEGNIVYAVRPGRGGYTRFVKERPADPCDSVVVMLKRTDGDSYVIVTAFIGWLSRTVHEPWDRDADLDRSLNFWLGHDDDAPGVGHALVWGSEPVIPGTETTTCHWDKVVKDVKGS